MNTRHTELKCYIFSSLIFASSESNGVLTFIFETSILYSSLPCTFSHRISLPQMSSIDLFYVARYYFFILCNVSCFFSALLLSVIINKFFFILFLYLYLIFFYLLKLDFVIFSHNLSISFFILYLPFLPYYFLSFFEF